MTKPLHDALRASTLRRVIIESPCSGNTDRNMAYLERALLDSLRRGEAPIASHGLFAFSKVLDDTQPTQRDLGIFAGFAWTLEAEAVVVYEDYGISDGMLRGILLAQHAGKPVEYRRIWPDEARPPLSAPPTE